METIAPLKIQINNTIAARDLASILDYYSNIKVLSLDCFDTLLWRMTATPEDAFFAMQQNQAFKSLGLTATLRAQAEGKARQIRSYKANSTEVTLNDIYREYLPTISDEQLQTLIEAEISTEEKICFAFPATLQLMRNAIQRGIKIIIVSDTYFSENQLRRLLSSAIPPEIMQNISKIFCSSEHNRSKINGLFNVVMSTIKEKPENCLHIGDNLTADYIAPRTLQLHARHFLRDNNYIKNLQRLQAITANLMDPTTHTTQPLFDPYNALLTMSDTHLNKPEYLIGYCALGPIIYSFAQFILNEIEKIRLAGKNPKVLFLMRDIHLPALACEALAGNSFGRRVRISRFTSYAASFTTVEAIDNYLIGLVKSNRFQDITRQLLLPKKVSDPIIHAAEKSNDPEKEFMQLIHRPDILRIIFKKSTEYRQRLKKYLEKEADLKSGDMLVLVDLGYAGTTQRQLANFFQEMNIEVEGRYLIATGTSIKETPRVGLLDPSHYDDKTLCALLHFIALFEQLCTANERSVIDYDDNGNVIYAETQLSDTQYTKLTNVQNECIKFINDAHKFFRHMPEKFSAEIQRRTLLADLSRLIYLPTNTELNYLQSFQFDLNLGTQDVYQLFDPKKGLAGLKRRGLFYIDKSSAMKRTNYPAELRIAGFELALTFMSQLRFNLNANLEDMMVRQEFIETHITAGLDTQTILAGASATHDGYYALCLDADHNTTFYFGKRYQWFQIESIELIHKEAFAKQKESGHTLSIHDRILLDEMEQHGSGLLHCLSTNARISIKPEKEINYADYVVRIVYRPVVIRQSLD